MDNSDWLEIRSMASKLVREEQEKLISRCLDECNIKDTFFYNYSFRNKIFTIYTSNPGVWIGYHGVNIEKITNILRSEYKDCNIEIKEIRGNIFSNKK